MLKNAANFIGLRRLRSGAVFSQYYVVPDASFDLDALGLAAAAEERDEEEPHTTHDAGEADDWEDEEDAPSSLSSSPLSSAPSTRPPSPAAEPEDPSSSDLSSAPPSPRPGRSPPAIDATRAPTQHLNCGGRKRRRKNHGHKMRARKRQATAGSSPSRDGKRRHAQHIARSTAHRVAFDLKRAPVTKTGFRGRYEKAAEGLYTRRQLVRDHGFHYYAWDGRQVTAVVTPDPPEAAPDSKGAGHSNEGGAQDEGGPRPSNDGLPPLKDAVIGVLAGRPADGEDSGHGEQESFADAAKSLADALEYQRGMATFTKDASEHRRGHFGAQACGISHGGGQLRPGNLKHTVAMTLVLMYLISLPAMVRIAHYSSSVFANWAPEIHEYYANTLTALLESDPTLARNFARSVWACITLNFGPQTVCFPHRDYGNLAFGWCAITALGNFDPDKGGELVLWDCKMVIRFPPGSTILIPSAILRHSNTRIRKGERRYSVTQYTAGSIFRWVEHGFQLDEKYYASLSREEAAQDARTAAGRWRRGRAMFARYSDLVEAAEKKMAP
ncbi:hypothetical protein GGF50DRAFT_92317 [Schizophyllum commune]